MALKLNPSVDYVQNNIGCNLALQERYDEAIEAFKKAVILNDQEPDYHRNLAKTYAMARRDDLVVREFELAGAKQVTREIAVNQNVQTPGHSGAVGEQKQAAASIFQGKGNDLPRGGSIEILNGNGVTGMARKMRAYLLERGFKVVRCANADRFDYAQTSVHYRREDLETAQQLLAQMPDIKNVKEVKKLERADATIKMVMGKDLNISTISPKEGRDEN